MTDAQPARPRPRRTQLVVGVVTSIVMVFVLSLVLPEILDGSASTFDYVMAGSAVVSMIGSVLHIRQVLRDL